MNQIIINQELVSRIEVIDETGRILVLTNVSINTLVQDNGRTVKVFVKKLTGERGSYEKG